MPDLVGGEVHDWLAVGWFTPDYRPLAEKFAANLARYNTPFHLFAKPKLTASWDTSPKPTVVLEAFETYPGKTIVLMDVDCIVHGNIEPVTNICGDIGITIMARNMRRRDKLRRDKLTHYLGVEASSRVVVFRDTPGARKFAARWADQINRSEFNHDEHSMVWAFLSCPDVYFDYIDKQYAGAEVSKLADGVIMHQSAHNVHKQVARGAVKQFLRNIERRFFRSGRTKQSKVTLAQVVRE